MKGGFGGARLLLLGRFALAGLLGRSLGLLGRPTPTVERRQFGRVRHGDQFKFLKGRPRLFLDDLFFTGQSPSPSPYNSPSRLKASPPLLWQNQDRHG